MKTKLILKRILCFMLVGCILSSSMFISYSNMLQVQASEDYFEGAETVRLVADVICVVLGTIGCIISGGVTAEFLISSMSTLWGGIDYVNGHVSKNEDGTYTIDEEFIQTVISSIDDVKALTFNDDNAFAMEKGTYTYTVYARSAQKNDYYGYIYLTINRGSFLKPANLTRFAAYLSTYGAHFSSSVPVSYEKYRNGVLQQSGSTYISAVNTPDSVGHYEIIEAGYSVNFPVFPDQASYTNYMETGEGYKDAINYAEKPPIDVGSSFTGTWAGGNITVTKKVLDNVINKVDELNNTDMTTDEKINQLVIFINSGGDGSGGTGGGGDDGDGTGSDDDEIIEGDSWLEKIFNVLVKISGKVKTIPADVAKALKLDAAFDKLKGVLDDILATLKSIRRWTIADTIIDGADFVESLIVDTAGLVKDLVKAPLDAFKTVMASVEALGDALKVKFPFCIPWDVAFLLSLFKAEPKAPHYELPLKFGGEGSMMVIDEVIVIDLEQFSILSRICRTILTIVFCKGLLDLTMKIVDMKEKEYSGS